MHVKIENIRIEDINYKEALELKNDLLKDKKINPTEFRINEIKRQFLILRERVIIYLKKQQ